LAYAVHDDTKNRNIADRKMVNELVSIPDLAQREKLERATVTPIISAKDRFGLGIKKLSSEVKWSDYLAEELHKPMKTFPEEVGLRPWYRQNLCR